MKQNYDISRQMQIDLIKAYNKVSRTCWSQQEAYEKMVLEPAPRYYVTPKQACAVISPMISGNFDTVKSMYPLRRKMYYDLYKEVIRLSEKREFIGKSLSYIMKHAVAQPAPRFYIGPVRARIIRGFIKNDVFDEEGRVRDDRLPSYVNTRENKRRRIEERRKWMLEKMSGEAKTAEQ